MTPQSRRKVSLASEVGTEHQHPRQELSIDPRPELNQCKNTHSGITTEYWCYHCKTVISFSLHPQQNVTHKGILCVPFFPNMFKSNFKICVTYSPLNICLQTPVSMWLSKWSFFYNSFKLIVIRKS